MDYCIKEVIFHLDRAKHILQESLKDPHAYQRESRQSYEIMAKAFPLMLLFSQLQASDDQSLSGSLGTVSSDEDSYASEEPPRPSTPAQI
jgi:hypothetical protein